MKHKLTLSSADEKDKPFFWLKYCETMQHHIEKIWGWDENWQTKDFESRWHQCNNKLIKIDELTVGYVQTQQLDEELYITMLIVLPQFRSQGIGQCLLKHISEAKNQNTIGLRVFRTNLNALKFYQNCGFNLVKNEGDFYYLQNKQYK